MNHRMRLVSLGTVVLLSGLVAIPLALQGEERGFRSKAKDPGPRPNPASAIPNPVTGLNANELALFNESLLRVSELEGTCDTCVEQTQGAPPIDPDPKNPFSPLKLINSAGMAPSSTLTSVSFATSNPPSAGVPRL